MINRVFIVCIIKYQDIKYMYNCLVLFDVFYKVSKQMEGVTAALTKAMSSMDLQKVSKNIFIFVKNTFILFCFAFAQHDLVYLSKIFCVTVFKNSKNVKNL